MTWMTLDHLGHFVPQISHLWHKKHPAAEVRGEALTVPRVVEKMKQKEVKVPANEVRIANVFTHGL